MMRDEDFTPGIEEGQEEGGERCRRLHERTDTDRETDRDELERHDPLWAKSSTYVFIVVFILSGAMKHENCLRNASFVSMSMVKWRPHP